VWSNSSPAVVLGAALWMVAAASAAYSEEIGCPATHNGKPLDNFGAFDGLPGDLVELIPRNGGWDFTGPPVSRTLPNYTLKCIYRGTKDAVTIVLPRYIRVCEFDGGLGHTI